MGMEIGCQTVVGLHNQAEWSVGNSLDLTPSVLLFSFRLN